MEMKPSISGRRISNCMPIQEPKEKPAIQQLRASGLSDGALAADDTAEIEPQHGKISMRERIIELIDDLVVHRAAELGMRMEHDGDRRIPLPGRVIPALDPSCGAGEDDLWHGQGPRQSRKMGIPARLTQATRARYELQAF